MAQHTDDQPVPVKAKAVLIDPASATVLWMNESAAEGAEAGVGAPLSEVVPLAETLGVPAALAALADSGEPQHVRTDLVSTHKGSLAIAASLYPLPDGTVLMIVENAWQNAQRTTAETGKRSPGRRR